MSLQAFDDLNNDLVAEFGETVTHIPVGTANEFEVQLIDVDPATQGAVPPGTLLVLFASGSSGLESAPQKGDTFLYKETYYRCLSLGSDKGGGTFIYLAQGVRVGRLLLEGGGYLVRESGGALLQEAAA